MNTAFINDDFYLRTAAARRLYHDYAEPEPIYDFHCHLPAEEIARDKRFKNLTAAWLAGDHYKWRAMRTNGVPEKYCTGDADDRDKFLKWADTVPQCLRNPLYHWTHLELARIFGISDKLLCPSAAEEIYDKCTALLSTPEFSARSLLRKMNVKLICTTEDPLDDLRHHRQLADDNFEIPVRAAFRPDKALAAAAPDAWNAWTDRLAELTDIDINSFQSFLKALSIRHDYFHRAGCRLSDHGLEKPCAADYTCAQIDSIFDDLRTGKQIAPDRRLMFASAVMYELALMNHEKGWTQQLHLGAIRNLSSRMYSTLGPDTGFDAIGDSPIAADLAKFLDRLDSQDKLAKTVLFNINPRDNELLAAIAGCFQDGSVPAKIQFGPAWWFLDTADGMTRQLEALSNLSLLSRFIGMTTDSRSFLSFPRHEYFRRILCDVLGQEMEQGLLPSDFDLIGQIIKNISFSNAKNYFDM